MPDKVERSICRCVSCPCTHETSNRGGLCNRCLDARHEPGDLPKTLPPRGREARKEAVRSPYAAGNPLLKGPPQKRDSIQRGKLHLD